MDLAILLGGLVSLFLDGEALVRSAVGIANRLAIPPLLIGLTVAGFGTSTPELLVSVDAALRRVPDIAIGNIVGSNIGNILLIVGLSALIWPIRVLGGTLRGALQAPGQSYIGAKSLLQVASLTADRNWRVRSR